MVSAPPLPPPPTTETSDTDRVRHLARRLAEAADLNSDTIVDTRSMRVHTNPPEGTNGYEYMNSKLLLATQEPGIPINKHAHGQIAAHTKVPTKFYNRLRFDYPDLYDETITTILQKENSRRLVRVQDGDVRAFLSDRYRPIDNLAVMDAVLPPLMDAPDLKIHTADFSTTKMYLKVIIPGIEAKLDNAVGDVVQAGVCIKNSEVGEGAFNVSLFLNVLACTNGMVTDECFRKAHLGRRLDSNESGIIVSDEARAKDDEALSLMMRDSVASMVTDLATLKGEDSVFTRAVKKLNAAASTRIDGAPDKVLDNVVTHLDIGPHRNGIMRHLIEGGDLSGWGVTQAITRTAHDLSDEDERDRLHMAGWNLAGTPTAKLTDLLRTN